MKDSSPVKIRISAVNRGKDAASRPERNRVAAPSAAIAGSVPSQKQTIISRAALTSALPRHSATNTYNHPHGSKVVTSPIAYGFSAPLPCRIGLANELTSVAARLWTPSKKPARPFTSWKIPTDTKDTATSKEEIWVAPEMISNFCPRRAALAPRNM